MTKKKHDDQQPPVEIITDDTPTDQIALLEAQIAGLTKQLSDKEDVAKRAQSDYIRLKLDMDAYVTRTEAGKDEMKLQGLVDIAKKLLPSVYQLKLMVDSCPQELQTNSRAQGVTMLYTKLTKELELLGITAIDAQIGTEPNLTYHAPISSEPVEDEQLKGKITKEIQQGYLYRKGDIEKVIIPATVVLGS